MKHVKLAKVETKMTVLHVMNHISSMKANVSKLFQFYITLMFHQEPSMNVHLNVKIVLDQKKTNVLLADLVNSYSELNVSENAQKDNGEIPKLKNAKPVIKTVPHVEEVQETNVTVVLTVNS